MDRTETIKIMAVLRAAYPQYYAKQSQEDLQSVVSLWAEMFADEPAQTVAMAVKALIKTRVSTFPPGIGEINEKILQLTQPEEMTELEAWALVRRAIRGASMDPSSRIFRDGVQSQKTSAQVKFENLPPLLQQIVNSPSQLAAWERLPDYEIETVIQSNFMRSYRAKAKYAREYMALPSTVKEYMDSLSEKMSLRSLEDGEKGGGGDAYSLPYPSASD